jgi:hypothetical protein
MTKRKERPRDAYKAMFDEATSCLFVKSHGPLLGLSLLSL